MPGKQRGADAGERKDAVAAIIEDWRRERPELDTTPLEVLARLHRTFVLYQAQTNRPVSEHGLSWAGFDVLTALRRAGEPFQLTAGELAASGLISSAGVTLRLDRLEKDGLIVRERDSEDRRVVHCRLTPEGLRVIDELFVQHLDKERHMLAGLTAEECGQLSTLLRKLEVSLDTARQEES
ncbi:MarR family winged helix-turn-helix transcriptional regulator [Streptomyces albus]|uniref:MarR family winged helix-turn-helix transcriptional regulator n=1 Tax=Streptomyces albus TaxID=1888 RepID=UPI0006E4515F|nr:MarR family transcriptional regulator [Streptomyces albus]